MTRAFKNFKWNFRDILGGNQSLISLLSYRRSWEHVAVRRDSELCIEGFPRSANAYPVAAMRVANQGLGHIARHSHLAGQVQKAVAFGVPTIVILRAPIDAIVSLKLREPLLELETIMESYLRFHHGIKEVIPGILLVRFETVTSDYTSIIDAVNEKWELKLDTIADHSEWHSLATEEVHRMAIDYEERQSLDPSTREMRIAVPNESRKGLKESIILELSQKKHEHLLSETVSIYDSLLTHAS